MLPIILLLSHAEGLDQKHATALVSNDSSLSSQEAALLEYSKTVHLADVEDCGWVFPHPDAGIPLIAARSIRLPTHIEDRTPEPKVGMLVAMSSQSESDDPVFVAKINKIFVVKSSGFVWTRVHWFKAKKWLGKYTLTKGTSQQQDNIALSDVPNNIPWVFIHWALPEHKHPVLTGAGNLTAGVLKLAKHDVRLQRNATIVAMNSADGSQKKPRRKR